MSVLKNIVFDWNGTLLDDLPALHAANNQILEMAGHKPVSLDVFREAYVVPFEELYRKIGLNDEQIKHMMDLETSSFHDVYEASIDTVPLRDGALEVLMHARDHKLQSIILSNHLVDPIRVQLKRLEVEHFFHEVLAYADRATQFKDMTKGERLRRFMEKHQLSARDTIIIGDSIEEIHIGREHGYLTVAITGGCASEERLRAENPDYLIHALTELKPILVQHGFVS